MVYNRADPTYKIKMHYKSSFRNFLELEAWLFIISHLNLTRLISAYLTLDDLKILPFGRFNQLLFQAFGKMPNVIQVSVNFHWIINIYITDYHDYI